ncbi:MAG: DUF262 domain-containing protein [Deltaproteobacteria bacterium]|jgi:uncharacterized protein with ParB-like and HNH nuclease domain|nr:DUF262 domain-containing protein [Deltaproteobacteria bacterium]
MKSLTATPLTIEKIFQEKYIIPEYQRPYSWENEQCETLWSDLISFFDDHYFNITDQTEQYFLGNIVIHPVDDGQFAIIDGQQRLTTLLLLIKALFFNAHTARALER